MIASDAAPGLGDAVRRIEDGPLLTGRGRFTDDLRRTDCLVGYFLRSPHAHAEIRSVDAEAARAMPGIRAVYTGADLARLGVGPLLHARHPALELVHDDALPPRHALARDRARYVGEAVALVVAESRPAALDAAELIEVDYRTLDAVIAPEAAACVARYRCGDTAAAAAAFARADHVVTARLVNNRLVGNPMEPRAALAEVDPDGRLVLHVGCQGTAMARIHLAQTLGIPKEQIVVRTGDIGGGFGIKMWLYPEYVALAAAARDLGAAVRWCADRGESFLADTHGRDQASDAALALDASGRFLGLRIRTTANTGAYLSYLGILIPTIAGTRVATGAYDIPALDLEVACVATNTAPVDAYRGAGRPESVYILERLVDLAARRCGFDPVDLRCRNFIPEAAMPFTTAAGAVYDSGAFATVLQHARTLADWDGYADRQRRSAARGRLRGRGLAYFIESTGANNPTEAVDLRIAGGRIRILSGTQAMGQGIATAYAQIVAAALGVGIDRVDIVQGDTDLIPVGGGSAGSRSLFVGGSAVSAAAARAGEILLQLAADRLEAAPGDIARDGAAFRVRGTDRVVGLFDLVAAQPGGEVSLQHKTSVAGMSWPNGCHICEVEVDPETGVVAVDRFVAVDDVGTVINPLLVHGQAHGGIAQGLGQALFEHCVFDHASGQLLTASFLDYALPRAADLPAFTVATDAAAPCRTNPLGAKGAGECGAIGAPPAAVSAVCGAIGIDHIDMPVTPEKVWRILAARAAADGAT